MWKATSRANFCGSCHIMDPYIAAWKASKHKTTECVECHFPPDWPGKIRVKFQALTQLTKWATDTYSSKPYAEVSDASCLRSGCHTLAELDERGARTFAREVKFDHRPHLVAEKMGAALRCTTCHSQIVVERHFEVAQDACIVCHLKGTRDGRQLHPIAGCTGCHDVPRGALVRGSVTFDHETVARRKVACEACHLSTVTGNGEAPPERCITCHNEREKIDRYRDTRKVHEIHVTQHPIECARCHSEVRHRLPPPLALPASAEAPRPVVPGGGTRP
jgi:hypothetical protein